MNDIFVVSTTNSKQLCIIDFEDSHQIIQYKWYSDRRGYIFRTNDSKAIHRIITNCPKNMQVHHKNHIRFDNRKLNLVVCTASQNSFEGQKKQLGTRSKYRGVCWHVFANQYIANIMKEGKRIHIGYFYEEKEAALAYNEKAKELFGEFAILNDVC